LPDLDPSSPLRHPPRQRRNGSFTVNNSPSTVEVLALARIAFANVRDAGVKPPAGGNGRLEPPSLWPRNATLGHAGFALDFYAGDVIVEIFHFPT
jgi:hypothetical protein